MLTKSLITSLIFILPLHSMIIGSINYRLILTKNLIQLVIMYKKYQHYVICKCKKTTKISHHRLNIDD